MFEENRQESQVIKNRILALEPTDFEGYLRSYIEVCGNNNDKLPLLAELLHSSGVYANPDMQMLWREFSRVNHQIELEAFENRLLSGAEQLTLNEIDNLSGYEFEEFLKKLFSKMGYQVEQTRLSGDQGADLVIVKFGEKTVIQAKRYGGKVGNYAVQEIMAAISLYQAQKGAVVTNSYFTPAAVELARANRIELLDRDALKNLVEKFW
jgi:restriction endonuclease Mrr